MIRRDVSHRGKKAAMEATQFTAFLTVTILQQKDDGTTLVSFLTVPHGLALFTSLAVAWVALWQFTSRLQMEVIWFLDDVLSLVSRMIEIGDTLVMHLFTSLTILELLAEATFALFQALHSRADVAVTILAILGRAVAWGLLKV